MESKNVWSVLRKGAVYSILAATMAVMASCGATKNSESGTTDSDTSMTQPYPDTSGTQTPMPTEPTPIDTMGQ